MSWLLKTVGGESAAPFQVSKILCMGISMASGVSFTHRVQNPSHGIESFCMSNLVSKSVALIEHRSFSECYFMRVFRIGPRFQVLLGDFDGDIHVALFSAELVA
jgi:hypothetical protein